MVRVVMCEQDALHLVRVAPRLARRLEDDLPVLRQAGIDHTDLVLNDQVRAHVAHPDPVDVMRHTLYTHA